MAALVEGRIRAVDSDGNPLSGATLTIYTANTTTPASIYRNAGLSIAMSNPTSGADKSDAGGWFPQIWAAEGTTVDITLKNASGVTVQTYEDVVFLGSSTGAFIRDLTTSRVQIRDSGGVVQYETGNASGDDVGGSGRYGGWNGTQGDAATFDYATNDFTGVITESTGKKLDGVVYTPRTTFSAVATVDIALPNQPAGVIAWEVEVYELVVSADGNLNVLFSANGSVFAGSTTLVTAIDAAGADAPGHLILKVITNTGTKRTSVSGTAHTYISGTGAPGPALVLAYSGASLGRCTHIRLSPASGTITGAYRVKPLRGYE